MFSGVPVALLMRLQPGDYCPIPTVYRTYPLFLSFDQVCRLCSTSRAIFLAWVMTDRTFCGFNPVTLSNSFSSADAILVSVSWPDSTKRRDRTSPIPLRFCISLFFSFIVSSHRPCTATPCRHSHESLSFMLLLEERRYTGAGSFVKGVKLLQRSATAIT